MNREQTFEKQVQELNEKLRTHERYAVAIAELEFDALSGFDINTLMNAACSLVSH